MTLNFTCEVIGGFPNTTDVTIECAGEEVDGTFDVTTDMDGQNCTCTGTHASDCYDKITKVQLVVLCE